MAGGPCVRRKSALWDRGLAAAARRPYRLTKWSVPNRSPTCQVIEGLSHSEDSQRHVGEGERATSVGCSNSSLDTGKYRCKQQKKKLKTEVPRPIRSLNLRKSEILPLHTHTASLGTRRRRWSEQLGKHQGGPKMSTEVSFIWTFSFPPH